MFWRGSLRFQVYRQIHTYIHDCPRSFAFSLSLSPVSPYMTFPQPPNQWALSLITLHNDPLFEPTDICGGGKRESFKLQLFCLALLEKAALTWVYSKKEFDHNRPGWVKEALNISWGRYCWALALRRLWVCSDGTAFSHVFLQIKEKCKSSWHLVRKKMLVYNWKEIQKLYLKMVTETMADYIAAGQHNVFLNLVMRHFFQCRYIFIVELKLLFFVVKRLLYT